MRRSEQVEARRVRGWIMRVLDKMYPAHVELLELATSMRPVFEVGVDDLTAFLSYLQEKEYVTRRTLDVCGDEVTVARLTVKGKDLVEGNIPRDPGVALSVIRRDED